MHYPRYAGGTTPDFAFIAPRGITGEARSHGLTWKRSQPQTGSRSTSFAIWPGISLSSVVKNMLILLMPIMFMLTIRPPLCTALFPTLTRSALFYTRRTPYWGPPRTCPSDVSSTTDRSLPRWPSKKHAGLSSSNSCKCKFQGRVFEDSKSLQWFGKSACWKWSWSRVGSLLISRKSIGTPVRNRASSIGWTRTRAYWADRCFNPGLWLLLNSADSERSSLGARSIDCRVSSPKRLSCCWIHTADRWSIFGLHFKLCIINSNGCQSALMAGHWIYSGSSCLVC